MHPCSAVLYSVALLYISVYAHQETVDDGGWYTDVSKVVATEGPCNIEVRDARTLSQFEFLERYAFDAPVVLTRLKGNEKFAELSRRDTMLHRYGKTRVRLSTANTHSYIKVDVGLSHYIEHMLQPQSLVAMGNETLYWFGDNNHTEWQDLFDSYIPPQYTLPDKTGAYSFGVAGAGTGVPFHFHGPGFAQVIYGRKRWFLYPPDYTPVFHPNKTTLQWLMEDYTSLPTSLRPLECTLLPNQAIYFPDRWWHGTLNIDTSVFISTFLG